LTPCPQSSLHIRGNRVVSFQYLAGSSLFRRLTIDGKSE
jgi:hypothetical protein